jgi:glycine/D-amino acid oxidase-like deaminating enzyme
MQESLKIWEGLADELGEDVGFARGGCTFTAKTDREMSELAAWVVIAKQSKKTCRVSASGDFASALNWPEKKKSSRGGFLCILETT